MENARKWEKIQQAVAIHAFAIGWKLRQTPNYLLVPLFFLSTAHFPRLKLSKKIESLNRTEFVVRTLKRIKSNVFSSQFERKRVSRLNLGVLGIDIEKDLRFEI